MRFDLTDLRLVIAIVEAGSITHGATRSALSLAAASARIKGMEETLGAALFARERSGVTPTAVGHALVRHARVILGQVERMTGELGEHAQGLTGHVRLLANTSAVTEYLPDMLASWLAAHPHVDVDLEERPSDAIAAAIAEGVADIGICANWADTRGLEVLPFRVDRLVLVVPRGHPIGGAQSVAFSEVAGNDFVGLAEGAALQDHLARQAARARRALRLRVRVRSFEAICRLVARGVGLGVVPRIAAERYRRSMAIRLVPLADAWAERHLGICVCDLATLPAHARRLVVHLAANDRD